MIDINQYGCAVGRFYQKYRNKKIKFMKYESECYGSLNSGKFLLSFVQIFLKQILILAFIPCNYNTPVATTPQAFEPALNAPSSLSIGMLSCWMMQTTAYPNECTDMCRQGLCLGPNASLSDLLSEIVDCLADELEGSAEIRATEELSFHIEQCNRRLIELGANPVTIGN